MKRNQTIYGLLAVTLITLVLVVLIIYPKFQQIEYEKIEESFETGFDDWFVDADVPLDPNNPGNYVEWHILPTTDASHSGETSLEFFVDGQQDDGTIWIERALGLRKNTEVSVRVAFYLYSETESFNVIAGVVAAIQPENVKHGDPEQEADFVDLGQANKVAGWQQYEYTSSTINTGSEGIVWIALGITVLWETYLLYYIDDVEIEIL